MGGLSGGSSIPKERRLKKVEISEGTLIRMLEEFGLPEGCVPVFLTPINLIVYNEGFDVISHSDKLPVINIEIKRELTLEDFNGDYDSDGYV